MFGITPLAACAPTALPAIDPDQAGPAATSVEISFMGWGGAEEDEGVRAAIQVFQEEEPNIRVNWRHNSACYDLTDY